MQYVATLRNDILLPATRHTKLHTIHLQQNVPALDPYR